MGTSCSFLIAVTVGIIVKADPCESGCIMKPVRLERTLTRPSQTQCCCRQRQLWSHDPYNTTVLYNGSVVTSQGNIEPLALRRKAATDRLVEKIVKHDSWPIQPDILSSPLLRLTSRKPLWLDLQPVDIESRWRHNWKSTQVVNSHLVCDPTIRQPGFDLSRQQWSLLNRFRTEQRHCGACRRKWRLKGCL